LEADEERSLWLSERTMSKKDPFEKFLRKEPLTDEALAELRKRRIKGADGYMTIESWFTCDNCKLNRRCTLAFDPYNLDGDCLLDK